MNNSEYKSDCEVCKQLIKEKHKYDFLWKIACIIFAALAIIFAWLYFGSGAMITTTEITIDNVGNENEISDNKGTIIIGNGGEAITGTIEQKNYTPVISVSIIAASLILVIGGVIIAHYNKKNN